MSVYPGEKTLICEKQVCTLSYVAGTTPWWVIHSATGSSKRGSGMREHNKPCHNPFFWVIWSKKSLSTQISLNKHAHNQILVFILSSCLSHMEHWTAISRCPTRLPSFYWALHLLSTSSKFRLVSSLRSFFTEIRRERRAESSSLQLCPGFPPRQDVPSAHWNNLSLKGWSIPCCATTVKADITYSIEVILMSPID